MLTRNNYFYYNPQQESYKINSENGQFCHLFGF